LSNWCKRPQWLTQFTAKKKKKTKP
jgi:hypothetical protein